MIVKNSRVKILDNYSGGLSDVKGRTAKVVSRDVRDGKTYFLLDIKGKRESSYEYAGKTHTYMTDYNVIVEASEIEEVPYEFLDSGGNRVDIGDIVVYATHGGGIIKGEVVDFKDVTRVRWGTDRKELKMKVQSEFSYLNRDGGDRSISVSRTCTQWLSNQHSTLILQKGLAHFDFNPGKMFVLNNG